MPRRGGTRKSRARPHGRTVSMAVQPVARKVPAAVRKPKTVSKRHISRASVTIPRFLQGSSGGAENEPASNTLAQGTLQSRLQTNLSLQRPLVERMSELRWGRELDSGSAELSTTRPNTAGEQNSRAQFKTPTPRSMTPRGAVNRSAGSVSTVARKLPAKPRKGAGARKPPLIGSKIRNLNKTRAIARKAPASGSGLQKTNPMVQLAKQQLELESVNPVDSAAYFGWAEEGHTRKEVLNVERIGSPAVFTSTKKAVHATGDSDGNVHVIRFYDSPAPPRPATATAAAGTAAATDMAMPRKRANSLPRGSTSLSTTERKSAATERGVEKISSRVGSKKRNSVASNWRHNFRNGDFVNLAKHLEKVEIHQPFEAKSGQGISQALEETFFAAYKVGHANPDLHDAWHNSAEAAIGRRLKGTMGLVRDGSISPEPALQTTMKRRSKTSNALQLLGGEAVNVDPSAGDTGDTGAGDDCQNQLLLGDADAGAEAAAGADSEAEAEADADADAGEGVQAEANTEAMDSPENEDSLEESPRDREGEGEGEGLGEEQEEFFEERDVDLDDPGGCGGDRTGVHARPVHQRQRRQSKARKITSNPPKEVMAKRWAATDYETAARRRLRTHELEQRLMRPRDRYQQQDYLRQQQEEHQQRMRTLTQEERRQGEDKRRRALERKKQRRKQLQQRPRTSAGDPRSRTRAPLSNHATVVQGAAGVGVAGVSLSCDPGRGASPSSSSVTAPHKLDNGQTPEVGENKRKGQDKRHVELRARAARIAHEEVEQIHQDAVEVDWRIAAVGSKKWKPRVAQQSFRKETAVRRNDDYEVKLAQMKEEVRLMFSFEN